MLPSLTIADLKRLLHGDYARLDKLLTVLASFDRPCQIAEVKERAHDVGYSIPQTWNVSTYLRRSKGKAIRIPSGWEITDAGRRHLAELGIIPSIPTQAVIATDLRDALPRIRNSDTRSFVEEAVSCYEAGLYRSTIVMSWVGAVAVLHDYIQNHHLAAFNSEALRRNRKWKTATTTDDLGRMRESSFLDIICALSVVGPNVKTELKSCLNRRNACGHPSSLKVAANTAAHHLEVLLLNVFVRF